MYSCRSKAELYYKKSHNYEDIEIKIKMKLMSMSCVSVVQIDVYFTKSTATMVSSRKNNFVQ